PPTPTPSPYTTLFRSQREGRGLGLAALYGALDELHARAVVVRRAAEVGEADDGEAARRGAEIGVFEGLCDVVLAPVHDDAEDDRSEEHTSELQSRFDL